MTTKERKAKRKKVYCTFCDKKVTLDKNSRCPKCHAVIVID